MPTYEYRCAKGHSFDVFQKMSDPPVATCPECGEGAERVLSGGAGFLFKGEGFYITDYRSEEYKKKAQAEKNASGSPDAAPDKAAAKAGKGGGASKKEGAAEPSKESSREGAGGSSRGEGSSGGGGSSGSSSSGSDG
jgi:putative FmdB family regulatory protein